MTNAELDRALIDRKDAQIAALTADNAELRQILAQTVAAWRAEFAEFFCDTLELDSHAAVVRVYAILQSPSPGADLLKRHAEELAGVIANYVHDHSLTCDCCQHVMIDVTAESKGGDGRSHCVAGDPEGEGMACAHGMAKDMEALRQRVEAAEERENRLDRLAEALDRALAAVTEKIAALAKERDEATARANAAEEAQPRKR